MEFENIIENINKNEYANKVTRPTKPEGYKKENYVYDEEKSVRWNKEHRLELEEKWNQEWSRYLKGANQAEIEFKNDLIKAIMKFADVVEEQAKVIYSRAYEEDHSNGLEAIVNKAQELSEFILDVINATA